MAAASGKRIDWRRSTFSGVNGECVEVAVVDDTVAVRDSKHPSCAPLLFTPGEWVAFLGGVRAGEFDLANWERSEQDYQE
ncbi:hypothetical protein GCM10009555_013560 [Acrocarpospora macrocephala]|uniref:DUF397 domain-containing protein n=1 Tax=Acrocarpospora macrocephala TaxID=150177 RepID=A0A5M3WGB7_9ACTN|nr:DUF397 domain-containing protein [Acrocarpospora macrocephala]GES08165.1 hypothetical protein Amac_017600 [Acrocarpospora macrocephala]